jgi:hypothetical protein
LIADQVLDLGKQSVRLPRVSSLDLIIDLLALLRGEIELDRGPDEGRPTFLARFRVGVDASVGEVQREK